MNSLLNYTGTKICEICLDHAITSYVFIHKTHYVRNRLNLCVTEMLQNLRNVNLENAIFIEVSLDTIMRIKEGYDENLLLEPDEIDESTLQVEKLEGEFKKQFEKDILNEFADDTNTKSKNPAKINQNDNILTNGYANVTSNNLNEFLFFRKKEKVTNNSRREYASCPICNKRFITYHFVGKHILKHVFKKITCTKCLKTFDSKFHLREHTKAMHLLKQSNEHSCRTCGRTFKNEEKRIAHEKCHISKQCQLCSKIFHSQKHFDNHLQRHALKFQNMKRKTSQTCSFCETQCPSDNELSSHVHKVHLQIKPHSCDMCERQFYTERNLKNHRIIHNVPRVEHCEFCAKALKCRRDLVVHIRKHMGNTPYRCILCTQKFYSELKMKVHMKKWHGGSFFCKLCRKVFVNMKGLKDHVNKAHNFF